MGASCLAERLSRYAALSAPERAALERLEEQERVFRRGTIVNNENDVVRELYVVRRGWLHSSLFLGNGSRQILRFYTKGDIIGLPLLAFAASPENVTAATDVTLASFHRERLAALLGEHPRLSTLILTVLAAEMVALADRLASIGRTPARARVAALICEFHARARLTHGPETDTIQIPLTQEDIGDATGLTSVHVNRMMRALTENGTIERNGNHIRLLDPLQLLAEANFTDRSRIEAAWLPPSNGGN